MLNFSSEEYQKEWDAKRKFEDDYYANKKVDEKIILDFQK
jgi:hypothetical protein